MTKNHAGFTLIEIMVALMILAIVAIAASQASTSYLRTVDGMRTRTLAHFVAQNTAAELAINNQWLTAAVNEQKIQQGRTWQVSYAPTTSDNDNIQNVEINVAEVIQSTGTNAASKTGAGSHIFIMLSKPADKR